MKTHLQYPGKTHALCGRVAWHLTTVSAFVTCITCLENYARNQEAYAELLRKVSSGQSHES